MSERKERLTVTLDAELVRAGTREVRAGRASSLSAWVNAALADRAAKERRLAALAEHLAAFEARHGEITEAEAEAQRRADLRSAVVVTGDRRPRRRRRRAA